MSLMLWCRANAEELFKKHRISAVNVSRENDVVDKVVELFERHKNENIS